MRKPVVVIAAGLLLCSIADAKKPRPIGVVDPRLAYVDDEPMSHRVLEAPRSEPRSDGARGLDDAKLKSASAMRGPVVTQRRLNVGPLTEANPEAPRTGKEDAPVSGAIEELVARQMRRHQASIDACAQQAAARHPTVNGTVALRVQVNDKKVSSIYVAQDGVRDIELDLCLVKAGREWRFDLHRAAFTWPVLLSTTAQR